MKAFFLSLFFLFIYSCGDSEVPVKKSKTGICHKSGSRYYDQTKHYKVYQTIDACIKSGGRLPKRK